MAQQLHTYAAEVRWRGAREGEGTVTNGNSQQGFGINVPPEFGGNGGKLNPEELLTDAITACYSITFGIVAANRKLPVVETKVNALATVEQNGANFVYRKIDLDVEVWMDDSATDDQVAVATDMAHKADNYCIITNAVRDKVEVNVSPRVVKGSATAASAPDPNPTPTPSGSPSDGDGGDGSGSTPSTGETSEVDTDGYAGGTPPTQDAEVAEKPETATPTEDSDQAGDPEAMKVGAVPG